MSRARVERERIYEALDGVELGTSLDPGGGGAMFVITADVDGYPAAAKAWYPVLPQSIDGDQAEGAVATWASNGAPMLLALNVGKGVPPKLTPLLCHSIGGKWTFQYDG